MDQYREILIKCGSHSAPLQQPDDTLLRSIPAAYYRWLGSNRTEGFAFLAEVSFDEAFAFIRGLSLAEQLRLSPFPGSTSLLIPAFQACQRRGERETAEIADWIVKHHDNPYTPFNFQRTRAYWESAAQGSGSAMETLERVRKLEHLEARAKERRARSHEVTDAIQRLHKGDAPPPGPIRDSIVAELERQIDDQQEFPDTK